MYTLLEGLSMAIKDPEQAGKWIEEAFGTLIQKSGWRICLNRQIFGKRIPLKHPITLKEPVIPEITVEGGVIYMKLPSAIETKLLDNALYQIREAARVSQRRR